MNKKIVVSVFLIILIVIGGFIFIKKRRPPLEKEFNVSNTGFITSFKSNIRDDIDGLVLKTEKGNIDLGFFPHEASRVKNVADIGDKVSVIYNTKAQHKNDKDNKLDYKLLMISNLKTNKTEDLYGVRPPHPPFEHGIDVKMEIKEYKFQNNANGQKNGIISENYFIDIEPNMLEEIEPNLKNAKNIIIRGKKRSENSGFKNQYDYLLINAHSIEIDGKTFLLR
ncbi:MAG: hypothetical protein U0457_09575 [Candidatus Sericytochromatia bacterium]